MYFLENICWRLEHFETLLFPVFSANKKRQLKLVTVQQVWMHATYDSICIIIQNNFNTKTASDIIRNLVQS